MNIDIWFAFFLAAVLISLSPGAGAVNTMSNGMRYGVRQTLPAILGLQLGFGIQIVLVGIGLGALIASSNLAFSIIKWIGVVYLIWLGYSKFREAPLSLTSVATRQESAKVKFWKAVLVNITNPKATIFLVALFPQFLDPTSDRQFEQFAIMGSTLLVVDTAVMLGYATLAANLTRWMKSERHQRWQNRIFGSLFMGAAALMASYQGSR
ncbi:MAG: homoserine/homoserine lactone efflux protein [Chromatiales bacterium]|nr:homoserine/homoserine lactone efflux protein [Chromatiales bacterium]